MAYRTGLENRSTRKGTQGSNPCLSAFNSRFKSSAYLRNPEFSRGFFAFTGFPNPCECGLFQCKLMQSDAD